MPTGENFGTNVPATFITAPANIGVVTITVGSSASWPTTPFTACFGIGTTLQEPIYVTNVAGTTWTVTRGYGGTTQQNQPANQTVTHVDIGVHFQEFRAHIDSAGPVDGQSEAVHGLTNTAGNVVMGTKETQTVTNKTLSSPAITGTVTGAATYSAPVLNNPAVTGTITSGAGSLTLPTSTDTLVGRATTDTLTNKTLSAPTITGNAALGTGTHTGTGILQESALAFSGLTGATSSTSRFVGATGGGPPVSGTFSPGDIVIDTFYAAEWVCTSGGTPGSWQLLNGTAVIAEQALTGTNTTITIPSWAKFFHVLWNARSDQAVNNTSLNIQFNADTGNNYLWQQNEFTGSTSGSTNSAGAVAFIRSGVVPGASATANYNGSGELRVANAQSTSLFKVLSGSGVATINTTATGTFAGVYGGSWQSTAAISSITLRLAAGNFVTGSSVTIIAGS